MTDVSFVPPDAGAIPPTPTLPSADDFRASLTPQLPSASDFRASLRAPGDNHDLLSAAVRGFNNGANQPLDPSTVQSMRDIGLLNDYSKGQKSIVRAFNEALLNSVAVPLYHIGTGIYGAVRGMAEAEPDDLIGKGISAAAGAATAGMEAFPAGHFTGFPVPIEPVARAAEAEQPATAAPAEAPAPETPAAVTAADEAEAAPESAAPEATPAEPDIHFMAGRIAPDLFREYDAIEEQRNTLRSTIGDLADMRDRGTSPDIDALDQQIDALRGQRLEQPASERADMANQITALEAERAKLADALPQSGDTPEMAALRQQMLDLDIQRRDMLPQVRDAYRQAAEGATEPAETAPTEEPPPETPAETAPAATPVAETPPTETETPATEQAAPAPSPAPAASIGGGIAGDVSKQLVAAGRPAEEADAAGALVQAHYEARAARFDGQLGTAEDLYRNEAPTVRAGRRQRAMELTQTPRETSAAQSLMHSAGLNSAEQLADFGKRIAESTQTGGLLSGEPFVSVMREMRSAAVKQGQVLDSIVRLVPVDVVNNLFTSERAAKMALHNEAMLEHASAFDAELPVSDLSKRGRSVRLLLGEVARRGAERIGVPFDSALEAPESSSAISAGEIGRSGQGSRSKRASITFVDNAKSVIKLMKDADASSFLHETGHNWLEELNRDAADERAPQDLRDDAATVRDWLGVEEGAGIPRRAHEKFARGFERYMMEGHAPSHALANVFAKFKDWLTRIYQTVTRLHAPINDDIRAVFDRMLATPEEKPVIAPGEPTRTFADMHEADAATTEPAEAIPVADNVRGERDRVGEAAAPEVEDERLTGRATAEGEGSTGGGGLSGPQEPGTEPTAGSENGVSEPGAVGESRGNAAPEGNRAPQGAQRDANTVDGRPDQQLPPVPPSRLVDKAGNIRLDNIDTDEDVKDAIREAAARNGDFEGRRRGVVSDEQREALANALGTTPDKVFAKEIGTAFSDSEIKMLEKLFAQSSATVRDLAIRFAQTQSEADDMTLATAISRHDMLQGLYSQATAEAGRAFRALKKSREYWAARGAQATAAELKNVLDTETGRTFDQRLALARKISVLDQPYKISRAIQDAAKPGVFDWIQAAFTNWLLSGPFTHLGYTAAGELFGMFRATAETAGGVAIARLRAAGLFGERRRALGEADMARLGEVRAQVYGMFRGNRRGLKAAWQALKENRTVFPQEAEPILFGNQGQAVGSRRVIPNPTISAKLPRLVGGGRTIHIGNVIESPTRMTAALHSFNWTTFYEQSMSSQAFRQAISEGIEPTTPAFNIRVGQLLEYPTDAMIEQGIKDAGSGALMQRPDYNSFMGRVSRVTNYGKTFPDLKIPSVGTLPLGTLRPIKFIDPFVQIQANIQKAGFLRNTPLALFSPEVRADLAGKNGGAAFDRTAGRILAGTAFAATGAALYFEGIMNNSGPSDPAEKYLWQRTHGMPHGLNVGGLSFDMLRLGVLGLQWSVAADLAHAAGQIGEDDAAQIASELVQGFAHNILDEGFARGPAELMQAVDDPDRYGASYIRNFVSSFMPFSVGMGQVARMIDPHTHRARSLMDAFIAKTPILSEELPPVYDYWGQPTPTRGWLGTYYERLRNDPVDLRLEALGAKPSMPQRHIQGIELTDQQYADYSRMAGQLARQRVEQFFNMSGSDQMPPQAQLDTVKKLVKASRRQAAGAIELQSQGTPDDILEKRRAVAAAALHGATPDELKKMRAAH